MKKFTITLITLFAFSLLFSAATFAQKRNDYKGMMKPRVLEMLELNDEQLKEIDALRDEHQLNAIDLRAELQKNRIELRNLLDSEKTDEGAVMSITEKNNSIHNKLEIMRTEMLLKMNSVLTPEQREKVKGFPMFENCFNGKRGPGMGKGFKHGRDGDFGKGFNKDKECRFRCF